MLVEVIGNRGSPCCVARGGTFLQEPLRSTVLCRANSPSAQLLNSDRHPFGASALNSPIVFSELSTSECEAILARAQHGRLAFNRADRVDIEPIHFVYESGWIYGRTGSGTKLTSLGHVPWVAFEVDEYDALFDWRSVVIKGTVYLIEREATANVDELYAEALELLRRQIPQTLTDDDPTPERTTLFRLHVDEMRGRSARQA